MTDSRSASTGDVIYSGSTALATGTALIVSRKKAKIMRKVKFPLQLDATEMVSHDVAI